MPKTSDRALPLSQAPVHSHGGDAPAVARALGIKLSELLDLSASLNPFAPNVAELATRHVDALVPYPDAQPATARLAAELDVDPERVVLTNGGSEAIALTASIVGSGHIVEPEFSLYRRHLPQVLESAGRWRSNPSNPLGQLADDDDVAAVWDEAFYPLATGRWTRGDDEAWRLGSLTKLWSCAGLRLGFVIAPDIDLADEVRARQPRWSVNGLALSMLGDLLDETDLVAWSHQLGLLGQTFATGLTTMGYDAATTKVNWILIQTGSEPAARRLRDRLLHEHILVRDCANFGLPGTIRVALPHPSDIDRVLSVFERCVGAIQPA